MSTWEGEYRTVARQALTDVIHTRMRSWVDRALSELQAQDVADRRNGTFPRHLLSELGDLELAIPRTRTLSAVTMLRQVGARLARRAGRVERLILLAFPLGLATRKVAKALAPVLGEAISPSTVSAVAKPLDAAVAAYHQRPLSDRDAVLVLDGVGLKPRVPPAYTTPTPTSTPSLKM